jgi:predicted transposase/invertase (TIGR01784 family)
MAITIDIKEDDLYQEVYQEGLQKGLQKGQEEGQLAAKEETARLMLKEGFADEVVARITKLPAERVAQLRQQSEAGQ